MKKFEEEEVFCRKCFIHNDFFKAGRCPECDGDDCILYEGLSSLQRSKARDKFYTMSE